MIDLFLLTPLQLNEEYGDMKEDIIAQLSNKENEKIFDDKWIFYTQEKHKNMKKFPIMHIIQNERNINLFVLKEKIIDNHKFQFENNEGNLDVYLISDEYCNFFLLYEMKIELAKNHPNINNVVVKLLRNRNLYKNLNLEALNIEIKQNVLMVIQNVLAKLSIHADIKTRYKVTVDASFPLIFIDGFVLEYPENIFKEEENIDQRTNNSKICQDYENGYFHIGWNYGIIQNLSDKKNNKILIIMIYMQMFYYQMRFYKKYFQKKINTLLMLKDVKEKEVEKFEKLKISYYKHYLDYNTYKNGLCPMYYEEFDRLEKLWHIDKDISIINEIFTVQNNYMNKKYQMINEKTNKKINTGLAVIAVLQIAAIYGITKDFIELKNNFPDLHSITTYSVIIIAVLLLPFFLIPIYKAIMNRFS
jgi:hypothetical protein